MSQKKLFEFFSSLNFDKATGQDTAEEFDSNCSIVLQQSPSRVKVKMCMSGLTARNCTSLSMYRSQTYTIDSPFSTAQYNF